ncbi:Uncharacterized protein Fot_50052 [Forsythia ovata]|uniref:Uncharacterized protein n=1 Tax=Forsythia ovata TaxID=205694 RepID=A0ABD1Q123_9LAMI
MGVLATLESGAPHTPEPTASTPNSGAPAKSEPDASFTPVLELSAPVPPDVNDKTLENQNQHHHQVLQNLMQPRKVSHQHPRVLRLDQPRFMMSQSNQITKRQLSVLNFH